MQEPRDLLGPPRRQRQERTVYTKDQQRQLESHFEMNKYPDYEDRKALADRLNLTERQVQVWFKNRRAKYSRLQLQAQRSPGRRGPGACTAPTYSGPPVQVPTHASPVFPASSGFCRPLQPFPSGIFPEAEPNDSSHRLAWRGFGYCAQQGVPAAPAPAPIPDPRLPPLLAGAPVPAPDSAPPLHLAPPLVQAPAPDPAPTPPLPLPPAPAAAPAWPQDPYASDLPDVGLFPDFADLLSPHDPFEESSVSNMTGYEENDFGDSRASGLRALLDF